MIFYEIIPKDTRDPNFLLYDNSDHEKPLALRAQYQKIACKICGKVGLEDIYAQQFAPRPKLKMRWDLNITSDEVYFCSERFIEFITAEDIVGCVPVQRVDAKWSILRFNLTYRCDDFLELHEVCPVCGRPRETCGFPEWPQIHLPDIANLENAILASDFLVENRLGGAQHLIASKAVTEKMKANKITGCEFTPIHGQKTK